MSLEAQYQALLGLECPGMSPADPPGMPLISEVEPGLWIGGCVAGARLPDDFGRVLSLTPERYELGPATERVERPFYDAPGGVPADLDEMANLVNRWRDDGHRVLVHCSGGRNRSGLVAGASLVRRGATPDEAIALLRRRSPMVLCNNDFEARVRATR